MYVQNKQKTMNNKIYFYFPKTGYFGYRPCQKYMHIEKISEREEYIKSDLDCEAFSNGGNFFAIVTNDTVEDKIEVTNINDLIQLETICVVFECNNYSLHEYYRSILFTNDITYRNVKSLIEVAISIKN